MIMLNKKNSLSLSLSLSVINACIRFLLLFFFIKMFGAMHFIYYISRSIATKVDSTYLGY